MEKSVADPEVRAEMVERYSRMATPLAVINGRVFWGFQKNRTEIERLVAEVKNKL